MDKVFYRQQQEHCWAQVAVDDAGHLTVYALGGLVPDDPEEVTAFLEESPAYKYSFGPTGSKPGLPSISRQENEYRLALVGKIKVFFDVLRATLGHQRKAARAAGLNATLIETLRMRSPYFSTMWDEVIESVTDDLEEAGLRRAINGVEKGVWHQGQKVGTERVYSDAVLQFMLQARRPGVYRPRAEVKTEQKIDASGVMVVPLAASADDWEAQAASSQQKLKQDVRN